MTQKLYLFYISILFISSCESNEKVEPVDNVEISKVKAITYTKTNTFPHDISSFTEGLLMQGDQLFESTGATSELPQTRSLFGVVDMKTGKIKVKAELDKLKYFGEGITILNGKIFQLTYKTKIGFIYDEKTFKKLGEFTFPSQEGWGMTNDGTNLIMSDGTNMLTYLDPNTLQVIKTLPVSADAYSKDNLNELEYINGHIYANVWTTNIIVKIDPANGEVVGELDLTDLANEARNKYAGSIEMNGIAYNATTDKVLVTGKLWPHIYEISISK